MPGLGISLTSFPRTAAVAIEDYVWDVVSGELTPAVSPGEEGYWNIDANGDLTPK